LNVLPDAAVAQLRQLLLEMRVNAGEIWWLPAEWARFPGGKDRYCLVVAVEEAADGSQVRVHYVCGTSKHGGGASIALAPGECGIRGGTRFAFFWHGTIDPITLKEKGRPLEPLATARCPEIQAAARDSRRPALIKVTKA
jgi:hypothetical protein